MKASIKVTGSIYGPNEPAVLYAQVLNADGSPANAATVTLNLRKADGTIIIAGTNMPHIAGSNGIYQYQFTAPADIERLIADVSSVGPVAYGTEDIAIVEWAVAAGAHFEV